jgi:outer membrane protein TolC
MEFMVLVCAKFASRAVALLALAALSVPARPQAKALDRSAPNPYGRAREPQPQEQSVQSPPSAASTASQGAPPESGTQPLRLTFQAALELARKNSTQFQAVVTNFKLLREDRAQARDVLLPSVNYNNSAIYTQSNAAEAASVPGAPPVVFIANNATHEYISQGNVHEAIDASAFATWRRAQAAAAVARAQVEIGARGLVVTVTQDYYKVGAAQQKVETAKRGAEEGDQFLKLTQDLENGGEVAHSDVIKAELQMQDRRRQLQEAQLGLLNARLDLAVLIFPNFNDNFEIADDLHAPAPLPTMEDIEQRATRDNPDLRAALEAVRQSRYDVFGARAGYLPALSFDYFYGIDAANFGVNHVVSDSTGSQKVSNLGSSAVVTLNIPIWNWGSTQSKVRQAELRQDQAKRDLSFAQRKLVAEIRSLYVEANTALSELEGLRRSGELAEESLRLTALRYKNGEATVLEVVDSQTTFATSNSAYQDGALRYRVALASLQTLTGVSTNP